MKIDINDLYKVKGIGNKTLDRIRDQFKKEDEVGVVGDFNPTIIWNAELYKGDCLQVMDYLIDKDVKINAIITDPPYGTTACRWDSIIPFNKMWSRLKKLRYDSTPIVLFGSEPFSSQLRMSNIIEYKYDWIWDKGRWYNFASVNYQPFKSHEIISIFSDSKHMYNPQMTEGEPYTCKQGKKGDVYWWDNGKTIITENNWERYPLSIQKFIRGGDIWDHPTQKPVKLLEYLIKTYTNKGDVVLDFTMGSGTTGVACKNLDRKFIGIEMDEKYFKTAKDRILNNN